MQAKSIRLIKSITAEPLSLAVDRGKSENNARSKAGLPVLEKA
jgi:hypothetical protein